MNSDILHLERIAIDDDWYPKDIQPSMLLTEMVKLAARHDVTWLDTFNRHCRHNNLKQAAGVLEVISETLPNYQHRSDMESRYDELTEDSRKALESLIETAESEKNRALFEGTLNESKLIQFENILQTIDINREILFKTYEGKLTEMIDTIRSFRATMSQCFRS